MQLLTISKFSSNLVIKLLAEFTKKIIILFTKKLVKIKPAIYSVAIIKKGIYNQQLHLYIL